MGPKVQLEVVQPLQIAGIESYEAGLFLAIIQMMERIGIDVTGIKPSDNIEAWITDRMSDVVCELLRLFPGHLPKKHVAWHPLHRVAEQISLAAVGFFVLSIVVAVAFEAVPPILTSLVMLLFAAILLGYADFHCEHEVKFAKEMTFRDLACSFAKSQGRAGDRVVLAG